MANNTSGRWSMQTTDGGTLVNLGKSASSANLSAALAAGPAPSAAPAAAAPAQTSGTTSNGKGK